MKGPFIKSKYSGTVGVIINRSLTERKKRIERLKFVHAKRKTDARVNQNSVVINLNDPKETKCDVWDHQTIDIDKEFARMTDPVSSKIKKQDLMIQLRFGSAAVIVRTGKTTEIKRNIKAGQTALARGVVNIVTPGVKIDVVKGVPLFHADPKHPDHIIRMLDGKRESGKFVNGKFKPIG